MDILTIGEVLIDLTQTGRDEKGIPQFAANPGGAPANLAVAASRLGAKTAFIGKVGADGFGRYLSDVLTQNGVDASGVAVDRQHPTTMAVVSVDASGERDFSFYRGANADVMLSKEDIPDAALEQAKIVHFGSVSLTADPSRSATLDAVGRAKAMGKTITYDPNYRANLWPDQDTAVAQMKAPLDLVDHRLRKRHRPAGRPRHRPDLCDPGPRRRLLPDGGEDRPCGRRPLQGGRHQRRRRHLLRRGPVQAVQRGPDRPDGGKTGAGAGLRQQGRQHHHQPPRRHPRHAHPGRDGRINPCISAQTRRSGPFFVAEGCPRRRIVLHCWRYARRQAGPTESKR